MEEEKKIFNGLSIFEKAWISANAYMNSNEIAKAGGIPQTEKIMTLSDYLRSHPIENLHIDADTKEDDRLKKHYVIPITVTDPGSENENVEIYIVVDSKYHDLAVIDRREEGGFRIADSVIDKIKGKINTSKIVKDGLISREELEKELIPSKEFKLKDLTETIAKGEKLEPRDDRDILRRHKVRTGQEVSEKEEEYEEEQLEKEEEKEKEEQILKKIPAKDRDAVVKVCEKTGMKITNLLQSVKVLSAESVADKVDRENITKRDGPVTILRFKNSSAELGNKIVMFQKEGERIENRDRYNEAMTKLMNEKSKGGVAISTLEDKETFIEYQDENGKLVKENLNGVPSDISQDKKEEFTEKFNDVMEIRHTNIENVKALDDSNKAELLMAIDEKTTNEVGRLVNDYGVELPKTMDELSNENYGSEYNEEQGQNKENDIMWQLCMDSLERNALEIENAIANGDPQTQIDALISARQAIPGEYGLEASEILKDDEILNPNEEEKEKNDEEYDDRGRLKSPFNRF